MQSQSRSCTELHKHLVSVPSCLQAKACSPDRGLQPPAPLSPRLPAKEDEEPGEACLSPQPAPASPQDSPVPGTAGPSTQVPLENMKAVVQLIRYMHTYCLPQRKLPPQAAEPAPQPCRNPSKQVRPWVRSQHPSKASWAEFSILRELLAQDVLCDVSKPYRLATPVYASLKPRPRPQDSQASSGRPSPVEEVRIAASPKSTGPRPSLRPLRLEVKGRVSRSARLQQEEEDEAEEEKEEEGEEEEEEEEWGPKRLGRGSPWTRLGRKLESLVCPVRRSRRLNPELGPWLTFTEESLVSAEPQGSLPSLGLAPEAYDTEGELGSPTDEDSGQDQQQLQGPQIPALESPCESGCGDTDEDPSCPRLPPRGSWSRWSARGGRGGTRRTPRAPPLSASQLPFLYDGSLGGSPGITPKSLSFSLCTGLAPLNEQGGRCLPRRGLCFSGGDRRSKSKQKGRQLHVVLSALKKTSWVIT